MISSLAARQGLLTRASNRLSASFDEHAVLFATQEDSSEPKDIKELHRRIRTAKATLTMEVEKVEYALIKYSSTVDEVPVGTSSNEEILKRAEANIDAAQIMKSEKLCKNCGGKDHLAMRCSRGACRICGTPGHHTSICSELFPMETPQTPQKGKKVPPKSSHQPQDSAAKMHTVNSNQGFPGSDEMDTVLHVSNRADVLILAGQAQVLNLETERLEKVHVLLDS
ncbi:hypothetical protein GCK32_021808 [Trichostrongylus colubriformis]|uniref:CCHC-type domain-containing protein n=1 Tax=Trichostrongylus colubriformis TaxID=6319 RepID=A0AAN8GA12_TRICO